MTKEEINREQKLSNQFNDFWNAALKTSDKDYLSLLSETDLISLKKIVSTINNIITLQTALKFVDVLRNRNIINKQTRQAIIDKIQSTNANSNGYDIEYDSGKTKIIAEVKCNIPVGKDSFGAAQRDSIIKDIENLCSGKTKSKIEDVREFYKFMVILNDNNQAKTAMSKLIKNLQSCHNHNIVELTPNINPTLNTIYIVYIP